LAIQQPTTWQTGFVIHRYYKTKAELKRSKIKYKNIDLLPDQKTSQAKDDTMRQERVAIQGVPYDANREGFEVLEHWCREDDGKVWIRAVSNRTTGDS